MSTNEFEFYRRIENMHRSAQTVIIIRATLRILPTIKDAILFSRIDPDKPNYTMIFRHVLSALVDQTSNFLDLTHTTSNSLEETISHIFDLMNSYSNFGSDNSISEAALYALRFSHNIDEVTSIVHALELSTSLSGGSVSTDLWFPVFSDIESLEERGSISELINLPLWPEKSEPEWSKVAWSYMERLAGETQEEHWQVWVDWWENRRNGEYYNIKMESEIALIPDEDWQLGPAHVNAIIAEIRARYAVEASASSKAREKQQIIDLLHTDPLRVALVDFTFDDMASLMRAVPFPEDNTNLEDESLERDRKELLSSLRDYAEDLAEDMVEAGRNSQDCARIARDLSRYAKAARGRPVRARMLWMRGADLNIYRLSSNIYPFLPEVERQKLDALVDMHLDLMRLYYRGALARLQDAEVLVLTETVSLSDLNGMIAQAVAIFDAVKDDAGAHIEPDAIAALRDLAAQTDGLIARLDELNPEERERSEKHLWAKTKAGVVTVARVGLRMKAHAADFAELSNVEYEKLMERILNLLSGSG